MIIFNELILKGTTKDYRVTFKRGLNIIAGKIFTGKSTILRLINYCLGSSYQPKYTEIRKVSNILLELNINDRVFTIERKMFSLSENIIIHHCSIPQLAEKHREESVKPKQNLEQNSISKFLLEKLNLWGVPLQEAPSKKSSETDIMSFRDIIWFCTLFQDRIDDQFDFLFEKTYMKNIKFNAVFKVIFGIYENEEAVLKSRLNSMENELRLKQNEFRNISEFLKSNKIKSKEKLEGELKPISSKLNKLRNEFNKLSKEEIVLDGISQTYQSEIESLHELIQKDVTTLNEKTTLRERLIVLAGQYIEDIRRLEALIEAKALIPSNVEMCPNCLQNIDKQKSDTICQLCNQEFRLSLSIDSNNRPTTELSRIRRKYKEIQNSITKVENDIDEINTDISSLNIKYQQKSEELHSRIEQKLSPIIEARENLIVKIEEGKSAFTIAKRELDYYKPLSNLSLEISELDFQVESLKKELLEFRKNLISYNHLIKRFSVHFYDVLNKIGFPKLDEKSKIDNKLIPIIRGEKYSYLESLGAIVITTQCWYIAFFNLFEEFSTNHPKFFLIDTPQKNIAGERSTNDVYTDYNIILGLYRSYIELLDKNYLKQLIIVDNDPPDEFEDYIIVRYSRDPKKPPYGLIDDETQ